MLAVSLCSYAPGVRLGRICSEHPIYRFIARIAAARFSKGFALLS